MEPFTYHLYHIPTNKHYYGARYKKGCSPAELWTSYFSSSSIVHQLIEEYGQDSFVPSVRKLFSSSEEAVAWEARVLARLDAQHNDMWINRHNSKSAFMGPYMHSDKSKSKISSKIKGIKRSDKTKDKMSKSAKHRESKRREDGWIMPEESIIRALATRQERIETGIIDPYSEARNQKMSASKKGTKRHYLPNGSFVMVKIQVDQ